MGTTIREVKSTPKSLINEQGELQRGVFKEYFKEFNLLNKKRPILKKLINRNLLTEWQAVEVLAADIFMICAVFKFGVMNRTLFFVYEIKENILHDYSSMSLIGTKANVAPFLEGMSVSSRKTKDTFVKITNNLNNGELYLEGYGNKLDNDIEFALSFKRIAEPSVVSVPMTDNHIVYTEKDLLVPTGYIDFKGKKHSLDKSDVTILDDHRGYYPLSSGYDWVTCMGDIVVDNKESKFGINLTSFYKNEEPEKINENGYWLNGEYHQLPSVEFNREGFNWLITDKDSKVNLVFVQRNCFNEKKNMGLKIDYTLAFGTLSGEIITDDNKVIKVNEMFSLGEKRLTKLFKGKTHNY
ncbi:hypothetical protein KQ51_01558 [Candidatus Izimaplasma bacterium HR1]|jgi:hypothetical protein|uniref:DUF2804 family protein n=1 Tax=Candidatus Izimoplasma sp. HR1 TaxID=1541959 RepID=UPI0004F72818|nr:hypothetical protein KQ51_01558 [Candidatus Izimaplasma bacterium HR1]